MSHLVLSGVRRERGVAVPTEELGELVARRCRSSTTWPALLERVPLAARCPPSGSPAPRASADVLSRCYTATPGAVHRRACAATRRRVEAIGRRVVVSTADDRPSVPRPARCTQNSGTRSVNSRVPSSGSTIQTRSLRSRSGESAVSSESQPYVRGTRRGGAPSGGRVRLGVGLREPVLVPAGALVALRDLARSASRSSALTIAPASRAAASATRALSIERCHPGFVHHRLVVNQPDRASARDRAVATAGGAGYAPVRVGAPSARWWRCRSCRGSRACATCRGRSALGIVVAIVCARDLVGRIAPRSSSAARTTRGSSSTRSPAWRRPALFAPATWTAAALVFVAFRLFDVPKPFPAGAIDRRGRGGFGVVGDDLVAGRLCRARDAASCWRSCDQACGHPARPATSSPPGASSTRTRSWIADKLFELGIDVVAVLTVGDYPERLEWAWRAGDRRRPIVVISTGGIGPTADDLTTETVAAVLGRAARQHEPNRPIASAASSRRRGVEMPREQPEAGDGARGAT